MEINERIRIETVTISDSHVLRSQVSLCLDVRHVNLFGRAYQVLPLLGRQSLTIDNLLRAGLDALRETAERLRDLELRLPHDGSRVLCFHVGEDQRMVRYGCSPSASRLDGRYPWPWSLEVSGDAFVYFLP